MSFKQYSSKKQVQKQQMRERRGLFPTCVVKQDKIIAFTSYMKLPIAEDIHTGNMELLDRAEGYDMHFAADYMLNENSDIYVLELNGKRLMKYNINDKKCHYIDIECNSKQWDNYAAFSKYGKHLYVFPRYLDELIIIDSETGTVQRDKSLYLKMENYKKQDDFSYFWCGCQSGKIVWLFPKRGNWAAAYDMEHNRWEEYSLSVDINCCVHVMQYTDKLYILSSEGKIYCWNMKDKQVEEMADCSSTDIEGDIFGRIAVTDKNIFLLPAIGESIFCIELQTREIKKYESYPDGFKYCGPKEWSKYHGYCEDDENYYFAMRSMNYFLIINKKTGKEKWIEPTIPCYEEFINKYIRDNELLGEVVVDIQDMLGYLQEDAVDRQHRNCSLFGEDVWQKVKSCN